MKLFVGLIFFCANALAVAADALPNTVAIQTQLHFQTRHIALEQAWQAFNQGQPEKAGRIWQQFLAANPHNADALHGLAVLAVLDGNRRQALHYFLRALNANPQDGFALAGLFSVQEPPQQQQTEERLKHLLAAQPDSAYLNFALGNLHAADKRWGDAHQAFLSAHLAEPAHPDFLFNLAISLDQLGRPSQALAAYEQALQAASARRAGFDSGLVEKRIARLTAQLREQ